MSLDNSGLRQCPLINSPQSESPCHDQQCRLVWDRLIATVALRIRKAIDLETILQTTADEVHQLLGCDRVLLYQLDPLDMNRSSGKVVVEVIDDPCWSLCNLVIQDECFASCDVSKIKEDWYSAVSDLETVDITPCYRSFLQALQVRSKLVIPILNGNQLWGLIIAHHCQAPRIWEQIEISGLQDLAVQVGIGLHQATLIEELRASKASLEQQIVERTALLEQANQTLQQLAEIVENAGDAMIGGSKAGYITSWNRAAEDLLGYTESEILGQPIMVLEPSSRNQEISTILTNTFRGHHLQNYPSRWLHKDGTEVDVEITISPISDAQGNITRCCGILRGIGERLAVECQVMEQAGTLKIFYEASPLMMGVVEVVDHDIFYLSQNPATLEFFGQEVSGQWASAIGVPEIYLQRWVDHYLLSQKYRQPVLFEYEHVLNGQSHWLLVTVNFLGIFENQRPRFYYVVQDTSLQKNAERKLRQAEKVERELKLFEKLLKILEAGYWDLNVAQNQIYMSPSYKQMLGYRDHELPNTPEAWKSLAFPEDFSGTLEKLDRHIASHGEIPYWDELRYRHKNGSIVWVQCSAQVIEWDALGHPLRIVGCHLNITNRKRAELALESAKQQLELVIKASSEGFWDWNLVTDDIYFSPQWKAMLGYADHELPNTLDMWRSVIFENDAIAALQLVQDYNNGLIDHFEAMQRFHHKDGSIVHILSRAINLRDDTGRAMRMVGSHLNMTEAVTMQKALKDSQMQLRSVLNSSLDGIMAFRSIRDQTGRIIDFEWLLSNPAACQIVGRSIEHLIGQRLLVEMPGNKAEGLFDIYVQVVESGNPYQNEFYYNRDDVDCWFESISVKLGDGFAVTFRDITPIKQSKIELQQLNQQLEDRLIDLKQRNQDMLNLSEISNFLQACLSIDEACQTIANLLKPLFPNCAGGLFLSTELHRYNVIENSVTWGGLLHSDLEFHSHACWGLRRGRPHWVGPGRPGLRCQHSHLDPAIGATLCVPMIAQGETLGLLHLSTEDPDWLPENKQQLAQTVAEQIALAIANLKLRETLQTQSTHDALTGLLNRCHLGELLTREIISASRNHCSIGIVMVDIDHFRAVNDTYGHDAGDYVLRLVAQSLQDQRHDSDLVCRYGGEEFVLIFLGRSQEETYSKAELLRVAIAQLTFNYNGQRLPSITASVGVAVFPRCGSTSNDVLQAADAALHCAKLNGRDRLEMAQCC